MLHRTKHGPIRFSKPIDKQSKLPLPETCLPVYLVMKLRQFDLTGSFRLQIGTRVPRKGRSRWDLVEGMTSAEVYRTGRSARFSSPADYWLSRGGPVAEAGRRLGIVSQVSCPIAVEGDHVTGDHVVDCVEVLQRLAPSVDEVGATDGHWIAAEE